MESKRIKFLFIHPDFKTESDIKNFFDGMRESAYRYAVNKGGHLIIGDGSKQLTDILQEFDKAEKEEIKIITKL